MSIIMNILIFQKIGPALNLKNIMTQNGLLLDRVLEIQGPGMTIRQTIPGFGMKPGMPLKIHHYGDPEIRTRLQIIKTQSILGLNIIYPFSGLGFIATKRFVRKMAW